MKRTRARRRLAEGCRAPRADRGCGECGLGLEHKDDGGRFAVGSDAGLDAAYEDVDKDEDEWGEGEGGDVER